MKITRNKKFHKTLMFFNAHFNYHEPYQVLIDATFCQAALKHKVQIDEQIRKCLQAQVKCVTTQCIILEAESLGSQLTGATQIVKQFYVHKCGHEGKPVKAIDCIKQMTKFSRYIVASQDSILQNKLRQIPGRCLLYLHNSVPVLEAPSNASKKWLQKQITQNVTKEVQHAIQLKEKVGLNVKEQLKRKLKRKLPKNPNPLSCKKSKKSKIKQKSHNSHGMKKSQISL